jgi:4-hydroxythreonine-4-phosphate dehydrogenase
MSIRPVIALTTGEPAGVGPEIALKAAWALRATVNCALIGNAAFLGATAAALDPGIRLVSVPPDMLDSDGLARVPLDRLAVIDCPLAAPVEPGRLDARNGRYVLHTLDIAIDGALAGRFDAIATAPLQKSTINDAGVKFTGHTEYLAERTGTAQVVMMLTGPATGRTLRVALATTHLALADVPAAITIESLGGTLDILQRDLQTRFGLAQPRILVAGLNPHAGEGGYLGREEIEVIEPALRAARARGMAIQGPLPADTLFQPRYLDDADCVLAMYHDQGLPVLKFATFGRGVNVTLGLPIIRTSVDHGTALDLAARGFHHADHGSMVEALMLAARMASAARGASA